MNGLSNVWDEIPLNIFLSNFTRIWERDKSGALFQGALFCLAVLYHRKSGPSWAIDRAWTPLGGHLTHIAPSYIGLPWSINIYDSLVSMTLFNIFYNKFFSELELNCFRQPLLA